MPRVEQSERGVRGWREQGAHNMATPDTRQRWRRQSRVSQREVRSATNAAPAELIGCTPLLRITHSLTHTLRPLVSLCALSECVQPQLHTQSLPLPRSLLVSLLSLCPLLPCCDTSAPRVTAVARGRRAEVRSLLRFLTFSLVVSLCTASPPIDTSASLRACRHVESVRSLVVLLLLVRLVRLLPQQGAAASLGQLIEARAASTRSTAGGHRA